MWFLHKATLQEGRTAIMGTRGRQERPAGRAERRERFEVKRRSTMKTRFAVGFAAILTVAVSAPSSAYVIGGPGAAFQTANGPYAW